MHLLARRQCQIPYVPHHQGRPSYFRMMSHSVRTRISDALVRRRGLFCPPNAQLQPRRLSISPAAVGCKLMFGRRGLEKASCSQDWGEIGLASGCLPEFLQNRIQCRKRSLGRCGDFNPDGLAVRREVDHQTWFDPAGPCALLIRCPRQVVVRRDRATVSKRDFEIGFSHDAA